MNKGIEWALNKAREELRTNGTAYRDPELRGSGWSFDPTGELRRQQYEKRCDELRAVIRELETANRVITFDPEGAK